MITKKTIGFLFIIVLLYACNNRNRNGASTNDTYQEKVKTVEEIERSVPIKFLFASGNYSKNFFGNKIKVHGLIKNTATIVTYKDVLVNVTYYSKTNTKLTSNSYTIYDFFPPNSEKKFELKIDNYKDVNTIEWDVISATPR